MADTQEFDNLIFPLNRFSKELLDELQKVAPSQIEIRDDKLLIRHLFKEVIKFIERYVQDATL